MGKQDHKVGVPIVLVYQAAGGQEGLSPQATVLDETGAPDPTNFPVITLTPIASAPDRYVGQFTPDAEGEWKVLLHDGTDKGKQTGHFSVGGWTVHTIGQAVATLASDVTALGTSVGNVESTVASIGGSVLLIQGSLETVGDQLTAVQESLATLGDSQTGPLLV
jgi:hypothetical protein